MGRKVDIRGAKKIDGKNYTPALAAGVLGGSWPTMAKYFVLSQAPFRGRGWGDG